MAQDKLEKHDFYKHEDQVVTQKDIKILSLEIRAEILHLKNELQSEMMQLKNGPQAEMMQLKNEIEAKILNLKIDMDNKINSVIMKLGTLIVACSGILFGLLSYFHK